MNAVRPNVNRSLPGHLHSHSRPHQRGQASQIQRGDAAETLMAEASQVRRMKLTTDFSLQNEGEHRIGLDSLIECPCFYHIRVHDLLIAPCVLRELGVPYYWYPSDHRFIIITESIIRRVIEALTGRTRQIYYEQPNLVDDEAVPRQGVEHEKNARFRPDDISQRVTGEPAPNPGHLRGGVSSAVENEPLSPLSPRRRPGETAFGYDRRRTQSIVEHRRHANGSVEYEDDEDIVPSPPATDQPATQPNDYARGSNLCRIQQSMKGRSQLHAREDLERERSAILEPGLEQNAPPRGVSGCRRHQRRDAVDLGTPPPWLPEDEEPWVLEQEATKTSRNALPLST